MTDESYEEALRWLGLRIDDVEAIDPATLPRDWYRIARFVALQSEGMQCTIVDVRRKNTAHILLKFGSTPSGHFLWGAPFALAEIILSPQEDGLDVISEPANPKLIWGHTLLARETGRYYARILDRVYAVTAGRVPSTSVPVRL